jgi:hypothetical protein
MTRFAEDMLKAENVRLKAELAKNVILKAELAALRQERDELAIDLDKLADLMADSTGILVSHTPIVERLKPRRRRKGT